MAILARESLMQATRGSVFGGDFPARREFAGNFFGFGRFPGALVEFNPAIPMPWVSARPDRPMERFSKAADHRRG